MKFVISFVLLCLVAVTHALSIQGTRLLSIWDDVEDKKLYSKFIKDLESRGYQISHATPKQEELTLQHLGARVFDHVMIFPTKAKGLGPNLTAKLLLDFINAGGNVMLAMSSTQPVASALNALLLELDIQLPADRTGTVVDHFNYDVSSSADQHDVLLMSVPEDYRPDTKSYFYGGKESDLVAFPHGVGFTLGNGPLLTPILKAPRTAYLYNPKEQSEVVDDLFAAGEQLSLVSTMQGLNSARFTVVGSAEMFQDKWMGAKIQRPGDKTASKSWNEQFVRRLSGWTFHEIGHLRVNSIEHRLAEEGASNETNPAMYRVGQNVTYTISISEWVWDRWWNFIVPDDDELQLEFSMLSPFQRLKLKPRKRMSSETQGIYQTTFTIPDQHGVFNFMVDYKRPFLTTIEEKITVPVRHMAHDEYPRSYAISGAWPYHAGIAATIVGWLAFVAIWMFNKPRPLQKPGAAKKTQ